MGAALSIVGLGYRYPNGKDALRDVEFVVREGESVALVGPNGAGKTTLLHAAAGLLGATHGRVEVFGMEYAGNVREMRRRVGVVFQETEDQLFCASVFDDVAFGPLHFEIDGLPLEETVREALDAVGLPGFEGRVPHELSSGERRRVALATVLAYRPRLLFLDEPTSDLDPRSQRELAELLAGMEETRVIASHDFEFVVRTCERTVLLDEGHIVADGATAEIVTDASLLEKHGLVCPLGWADLGPDGVRARLRPGGSCAS